MGDEMNSAVLARAMAAISGSIHRNREYLTELDARCGDGDLGISMDHGFRAVSAYLQEETERDLGKLFLQCSSVFNENASSSLGTILSFLMMGMGRTLRGTENAGLSALAAALDDGLALVMEKAKSKPGEKTILDSMVPAAEALKAYGGTDWKQGLELACEAAAAGCERTREMRSVHGRAAYYGDQSIGALDGGAVVGSIIFQALREC